MGNMCNECFELFDDFYKFDVCLRRNCSGDIVHIDDLIQSAVKILCEKHYYTLFCCSGHDYETDSSIYIKFDDEVDLPNIPIGFKYDGYSTIRKEIKSASRMTRYKEICENTTTLLRWAMDLPINPLMEEI